MKLAPVLPICLFINYKCSWSMHNVTFMSNTMTLGKLVIKFPEAERGLWHSTNLSRLSRPWITNFPNVIAFESSSYLVPWGWFSTMPLKEFIDISTCYILSRWKWIEIELTQRLFRSISELISMPRKHWYDLNLIIHQWIRHVQPDPKQESGGLKSEFSFS